MNTKKSKKYYDIIKGLIRINIGFSLFRCWSLDKKYPNKTSIHLFDIIKKIVKVD